jgi:hypothetical protein
VTPRGGDLKARRARLERAAAERVLRGSPSGAWYALRTGTGTDGDLAVIYQDQKPGVARVLRRHAVGRVLGGERLEQTSLAGWTLAAQILACPPDEEVPGHLRKELAEERDVKNPHGNLAALRPRVSDEYLVQRVKEWVVDRLVLMYLDEADELALRREIAARAASEARSREGSSAIEGARGS